MKAYQYAEDLTLVDASAISWFGTPNDENPGTCITFEVNGEQYGVDLSLKDLLDMTSVAHTGSRG